MNIVIDARIFGEKHGGIGRYAKNLVQNLSILDKKNNFILIVNKLDKEDVENLKLSNNWEIIYVNFSHYSFKEQILLLNILNEIKADLVHFTHFNVPIFYKGKFVVTLHDLSMHRKKGFDSTTKNPIVFFVKRFAYKVVFNFAINNSCKIITPSFFVKEEMISFYKVKKEKIEVVYEGIGEKFFTTKKLKQEYKDYFLYVGSVYPHKNLKRTIEAFKYFNSSKKYSLIITGLNNKFKSRLVSKNKDKYIKILGYISDKDLISLMQNSEALLFPSTMEGFGLPGLEAMASKTLLLCSNIPVFKEIYKDNAIYFNPFDFSSISKSLNEAVLLDDKKRKKIISKAYIYAQKFSWVKCARETLNIYESSNCL